MRSPNMQITNYVYDCVNGRACINYSKSRGFTRLYNSMLYAWHLLYRCYKTKFCKSLIAENFITAIKKVKNSVVKDIYEICIRFLNSKFTNSTYVQWYKKFIDFIDYSMFNFCYIPFLIIRLSEISIYNCLRCITYRVFVLVIDCFE